MNTKILIVDDSRTDQAIIRSILQGYNLQFAGDGIEAMETIKADPEIELMILDLNMPRMNGFEVLEAMQKEPAYQKISTIILTNHDETENEIRGLELGALDYIRKPLNLLSLRKRIEVHINLNDALKRLELYNTELEKIVQQRTIELVLTRDITIHALIGLLEVRDFESANHGKRTQWMMKALCEHLSTKDKYRDVLSESYIKELFDTAPLHDIGKVGIPDNILLKPARLSTLEFEIIKKHTRFGVEALGYAADAQCTVSFIETAIEIIETHHEKYDGSGYPHGLKGEDIPLSGRLMAIIDVYDALTNKRVYKPAFEHNESLQIIASERNKHFDSDIVEAFLEIKDTIKDIGCTYSQERLAKGELNEANNH